MAYGNLAGLWSATLGQDLVGLRFLLRPPKPPERSNSTA